MPGIQSRRWVRNRQVHGNMVRYLSASCAEDAAERQKPAGGTSKRSFSPSFPEKEVHTPRSEISLALNGIPTLNASRRLERAPLAFWQEVREEIRFHPTPPPPPPRIRFFLLGGGGESLGTSWPTTIGPKSRSAVARVST